MGYTHYFTQKRTIAPADWAVISADVAVILAYAEHEQGITLADGSGEGGTRPEFTGSYIAFNGLGDDSHETFDITRKRRAGDFCKTARKPYDLAVTAVLAYLSSVAETHHVISDGTGADWLAGVELVRKALPAVGNTVDIPRGVMEDDRWTGPYITNRSSIYSMRFCVDGKAYIIRTKDQLAYVFPTHREAAEWAKPHETDLLRPMGSFDQARWARIQVGQTRLFKAKFEHGLLFAPERIGRPPLYVRPNQFPALPHRAYYLSDLLELAA